MNTSKGWQRFVAAVVLLASVASRAPAVVLYRETFGRITTGNQSMQLWDWALFNAAGGNGGNSINGGDPGRPIDLANTTSAGPASDGTFNAYEDGWAFLDGTDQFAMTPEFLLGDPTSYPNGLRFSWYQGVASTTVGGFQVAVKQGGNWYVSAQVFDNTAAVTAGGNFGTMPAGAGGAELMLFNYSATAANWLTLDGFTGDYTLGATPGTGTFTASGAITQGTTPGANLSGPITAFGLWRNTTINNSRFDTFTIEHPSVLGDTDLDGIGGEYPDDFNPIRDNFRKTPRSHTQGDLTGNNVVDFADFREWKTAHGASGASLDGIDFGSMFGAVPEPSGVLLASLGLVSLTAWRWRVARPERQAMGVARACTTTTPFAQGSGTCHPEFPYSLK